MKSKIGMRSPFYGGWLLSTYVAILKFLNVKILNGNGDDDWWFFIMYLIIFAEFPMKC